MRNPWVAWIATNAGLVRPNNEDRCFVGDWRSHCDGVWTIPLVGTQWTAAVADGMGGHQAGELASETVIGHLQSRAAEMTGEQTVRAILEWVNEQVFDAMHSPQGRQGMGATVVGVSVRSDVAVFYNVGDSRSYVLRRGTVVQQSLDHTPASGSPSRSRSHLLTQSIGGTSRRTPLAPSITITRLAKDDTVLLCSDGLTDMLSDDEISDILRRDVDHPARALAAAAMDAGGHDNVTVIVVGADRERDSNPRAKS